MEQRDVILVDEDDKQIGLMEKMEAHRKSRLHRAFSIFIFNSKGEMLLQRRAAGKYHSAGLWTNACCSHPLPNEETREAAHRRLKEELGFNAPIRKIFDFIYRADLENGLSEHEFDHVFAGVYDGPVEPNPLEVSSYKYLALDEIAAAVQRYPEQFTYWFRLAFDQVRNWAQENVETGLLK